MAINEIFQDMKKYFDTDITKTLFFRQKQLMLLATAIKKYENQISHALQKDLNKAPQESYMTETGIVLEEIRYAIKKLPSWNHIKRPLMPLSQFLSTATVESEPYGLALIIAPWNYPFQLALSPLIGGIAAGNCCIIKPSEFAPNTSKVIADLIAEVFDPQYITVIQGGIAQSQSLLQENFDYIFFTGSAKVGKIVMAAAAQHLTPVTLELGGKSPCIVQKSADLKIAARRIAFGKFLNAGQTCVAPDYLLIEECVKKQFLLNLKTAIEEFFGTDPLANEDYPKIVTENHYHRLLELIKGEDTIIGGNGEITATKIAPTVLDNVTWDAPIMQEEIFGPILPVITFKHLEDALFKIKRRDKPLALYLFTQDIVVEQKVIETISFGGGCINDTIIQLSSPKLPFGGVGKSGMGSYHGKASFDTFSHKKSILRKRNFPDINLRYHPYTSTKLKWIKRFMR